MRFYPEPKRTCCVFLVLMDGTAEGVTFVRHTEHALTFEQFAVFYKNEYRCDDATMHSAWDRAQHFYTLSNGTWNRVVRVQTSEVVRRYVKVL